MSFDLESLGDDSKNPRKFVFLIILGIATAIGFLIFTEGFSKLSVGGQAIYLSNIALSVVSIASTIGLLAYMALNRDFKNKILLALIILAVFASAYFMRELVTFFSISGSPSNLALGTIYFLLGLFSTGYLTFTVFFPKTEEPLDSVTSEEDEENILGLSFKWRVMIAVGLAVFTVFYVVKSGQAFVQTASFGLLDSQLGNAFVSGFVVGTIETSFFFAILYPLIHGLVSRITGSGIMAALVGLVAITAIFVGFHTTVYKYSESSLVAVGIFGLGNALIVFITRDNFPNLLWHITNNFMVVLFAVTTFQIVLA